MSYKDKKKQKLAQRKYAKSEKGRATAQRYLKTHKTELAKKRATKREEARERRLQAFCRWHSIDCWMIKRLLAMRANGIDIEKRDPWNAKYVFKWLRKLSEEEKKERKERKKSLPIQSLDYY